MQYTAQKTTSLIEILQLHFPASSKNTLRSWISDGRISVNGILSKKASLQIEEGQIVEIGDRKKVLAGGISILYEDQDLVIIHKPSGLLSVATTFEKGETAHAILKKFYRAKHVFVVHRLDQYTSGVMVFALNENSLEGLKNLFETHSIERAYTAVVEGEMQHMSGTWKSYQYEDEQYYVHETEDPKKGKLAITHFRCLAKTRYYSKLELRLETGRKNQIRVHCQSAGYPIAGDKKYGAQSNPIKRLCLHAHLLGFQHPISKKKLTFEVPAPDHFDTLISKKKNTRN